MMGILEAKLDWAKSNMPATQAAMNLSDLTGVRISIALNVDAKMAAFCQALLAKGAIVTVFADEDASPELMTTLEQCGATVLKDANQYIQQEADLALDEIGLAIDGVQAATTHPDAWADAQSIVTDVSSSKLDQDIYQTTGVGQAVVMAFVDITNLQLAGRSVGVLGFDYAGRGVAAHISALGGKVVILTTDSLHQVLALNAGYSVRDLADAAKALEVVFATDGQGVPVKALNNLPDGALLCASTASAPFHALASTTGTDVRDFVTAHALPSGKTVHLIAKGGPVHLAAGEGVPVEVADIRFALLLSAALQAKHVAFGLYPVDPILETQIATWKIHAAQTGRQI